MCSREDDPSMIDRPMMCGLCLTCWPLPRKGGTACHDPACPCHVERWNREEDARITAKLRDDYPGYRWPGTDPIEAEDDDEDRIEAEDDARREEWSEYLSWQRDMGAMER